MCRCRSSPQVEKRRRDSPRQDKTCMNLPMGAALRSATSAPCTTLGALDRVSGGSGGPAAATASELCFGSLGTDTAGSIRIPASYCGIVGFKPSYGRVSNRGVVPLSWTLDHVGPLCRSVEDAAIVLSVIAGYDELDPSTVQMPVPDYSSASKVQLSKLRLGIPRSPFFEGVDVEIAKAVDAAIEVLRKLAGVVSEVTLPVVRSPTRRSLKKPFSPSRRLTKARANGTKAVRS